MTLYISDLDGTLLNSKAELSDFSRTQLIEMICDGLLFTVASARSVSSIQYMLSEIPLRLPVIEFNGAFISDLTTGAHEIVNAMDQAIVADIYNMLVLHGVTPFLATFNGREDCLYSPEVSNGGMQWYADDRKTRRDPRLRQSDDMTTSLKEQVICLTSIGRLEVLADLSAIIAEKYGPLVELHLFENQYSPGWYWLTIHDRRATKDQAIRILRDAYGLSDRSLVVFGDQLNDLKMFQIADQSIAVENAVALLKAKAHSIIGGNDEDSVVRFIQQHRMGSPELT